MAGSPGTINCVNGHPNPLEAKFCGICGGKVEEIVDLPRKQVTFVGVGGTGINILTSIAEGYSKLETNTTSIGFLGLNAASDEVDEPSDTSDLITYVKFGERARKVKRSWVSGESSFLEEESILDQMEKAGVTSSDLVMVISAISGGTGSGVPPPVLELIDRYAEAIPVKTVTALLPAMDEPDVFRFNAYCGLSRLIEYRGKSRPDMIILIGKENLMSHGDVDNEGKEMTFDRTVASILDMTSNPGSGEIYRWLEPADLVLTTRSTGVIHFVPCLALNHSLRIYQDLESVLDSALLRPLAEIDPSSSLYTHIFLRVPKFLKKEYSPEAITKSIYKWRKKVFPEELGGDYSITYVEKNGDKVDALILLGGCTMDGILRNLIEGYRTVASSLTDSRRRSAYKDLSSPSKEELGVLEVNMQEYLDHVEKVRKGQLISKGSAS